MAKIILAKYPEEQKQVDDLRVQQLDIITKWISAQEKPPEGLVELESQKTAIAVSMEVKPIEDIKPIIKGE